jgi:hypothetical protein
VPVVLQLHCFPLILIVVPENGFGGLKCVGEWNKLVCSIFISHVCKIAKSYYLLHVRQYVRMEQLGSHYTDFHENWYLGIFFESLRSKLNFH